MGRLAIALFLVTAFPSHAQMYKCVDERGVTHYSDKPQPGCKGGKVPIHAIPPVSGKVAPPPDDRPRQDADFKRRQNEREHAEAANKAALEQRCARLRQEHTWLSSGGRISEINTQGQRVYVDDASRDTRLLQVREGLRGCP